MLESGLKSPSEQSSYSTDFNTPIKRQKKSPGQLNTLKKALRHKQTWTQEDMLQLSETTGLNRLQVYKWYWDQKQKRVAKKLFQPNLTSKEILPADPLDQDLQLVLASYRSRMAKVDTSKYFNLNQLG